MTNRNISEENRNVGNFPTIEALVAELEALGQEEARLDASNITDDATFDPIHKRMWALRALISATPARNFSDLQAKAQALKIETKRDEDFGCVADGSARDQAQALADDIIAMNGKAIAA
jgi:hypothetical protein